MMDLCCFKNTTLMICSSSDSPSTSHMKVLVSGDTEMELILNSAPLLIAGEYE